MPRFPATSTMRQEFQNTAQSNRNNAAAGTRYQRRPENQPCRAQRENSRSRTMLRSPARPYSSSGSSSFFSGSGMTYFSEAQFPRSIILHRSLQKGKNSSPADTGFRHI